MKLILSYLKNHRLAICIIIALLVGQAFSELALPGFSRQLINIGVQQYGIEHQAPEKLTAAAYDRILLVTEESARALVQSSWDASAQNEYTLNETGQKNQAALDSSLARSHLILASLEGGSYEEPYRTLAAETSVKQAVDGVASRYVPSGTAVLDWLSEIPDGQRTLISGEFNAAVSKFYEESPAKLQETAISFVRMRLEEAGVDTAALQMSYLYSRGITMLLFALAATAISIANGFFTARVSSAYGRDVRRDVFKKVLSYSTKEMDQFSTASLITRSTNDITNTQMMLMMGLRVIIFSPIMASGGFINVVRTNVSMAWIVFIAIACTMITVFTLFRIVTPRFRLVQEYVDKMNLIMREILSGLPVIRAFGTAKQESARFDVANDSMRRIRIFINRRMSLMFPLMMFFMNGVSILIVYIGGKNVIAGTMRVGDIQAYIAYTMQIIMSFQMISMISIQLPRALISLGRLKEILTTDTTILDPEKPESFKESMQGTVEFRNVSFRYPEAEEDVLADISFTALPGQTTAIIGGTGSGKSTLIHLIPRFFDVTGGEIFVNGINTKQGRLEELRNRIGYIPQSATLFSGDIASNIKFSDPGMSDESMKEAAAIAQASGFIEDKDEKYLAPIAQAGTNVSGGQKQRLSIARAIAKKPEIYIFDDSFSAVDYATDVKLRKALKEQTKAAAVIIVAQRISTIMTAEKILVLDQGRTAGIGTHEELMASCEVYRQIATSQLNEEELK